jgi:hypothetical protein
MIGLRFLRRFRDEYINGEVQAINSFPINVDFGGGLGVLGFVVLSSTYVPRRPGGGPRDAGGGKSPLDREILWGKTDVSSDSGSRGQAAG